MSVRLGKRANKYATGPEPAPHHICPWASKLLATEKAAARDYLDSEVIAGALGCGQVAGRSVDTLDRGNWELCCECGFPYVYHLPCRHICTLWHRHKATLMVSTLRKLHEILRLWMLRRTPHGVLQRFSTCLVSQPEPEALMDPVYFLHTLWTAYGTMGSVSLPDLSLVTATELGPPLWQGRPTPVNHRKAQKYRRFGFCGPYGRVPSAGEGTAHAQFAAPTWAVVHEAYLRKGSLSPASGAVVCLSSTPDILLVESPSSAQQAHNTGTSNSGGHRGSAKAGRCPKCHGLRHKGGRCPWFAQVGGAAMDAKCLAASRASVTSRCKVCSVQGHSKKDCPAHSAAIGARESGGGAVWIATHSRSGNFVGEVDLTVSPESVVLLESPDATPNGSRSPRQPEVEGARGSRRPGGLSGMFHAAVDFVREALSPRRDRDALPASTPIDASHHRGPTTPLLGVAGVPSGGQAIARGPLSLAHGLGPPPSSATPGAIPWWQRGERFMGSNVPPSSSLRGSGHGGLPDAADGLGVCHVRASPRRAFPPTVPARGIFHASVGLRERDALVACVREPASRYLHTSGLSNIGSTCWLAATVQCVIRVPQLFSFLEKHRLYCQHRHV